MMIGLSLIALAASAALDPADQSRWPQPEQNLAAYVTNDDYPVEALARNGQGTVGFRLTVDAEGRPIGCAVEQSAGDAALDEVTCRIMMERARFTPAHDPAGHAVAGAITARITWRIQQESVDGLPVAPLRFVLVSHSSAAGELDCALTANGAPVSEAGVDMCEAAQFIAQMPTLEHPPGELTLITIFTPAGQTTAADDGVGHGSLWFDGEARLSIAPSGEIADCRATRQVLANRTAGEAPSPCERFNRRHVFQSAAADSGMRFVTVRTLAYLRPEPPG